MNIYQSFANNRFGCSRERAPTSLLNDMDSRTLIWNRSCPSQTAYMTESHDFHVSYRVNLIPPISEAVLHGPALPSVFSRSETKPPFHSCRRCSKKPPRGARRCESRTCRQENDDNGRTRETKTEKEEEEPRAVLVVLNTHFHGCDSEALAGAAGSLFSRPSPQPVRPAYRAPRYPPRPLLQLLHERPKFRG